MTRRKGLRSFCRAAVQLLGGSEFRYAGARGILRAYGDIYRALRRPRFAAAHLLAVGGVLIIGTQVPSTLPFWSNVGALMIVTGFQVLFLCAAFGTSGSRSRPDALITHADTAILEAERLRRRLVEREAEIETRIAKAAGEAFAMGLVHGRRGHYVVDFEDGLDETG